MSQYKHLLVAVDFSEPSIKALDTALELAVRLGAHLTIVHTVVKVAQSVSMNGGPGYDVPLFEKEIKESRAAIEKLLKEKNKEGVKTEIIIESGAAEEEINRIADEKGADMLILGTHGRKGMEKLFLGSVAEEVLRNSHLPFLCVRSK